VTVTIALQLKLNLSVVAGVSPTLSVTTKQNHNDSTGEETAMKLTTKYGAGSESTTSYMKVALQCYHSVVAKSVEVMRCAAQLLQSLIATICVTVTIALQLTSFTRFDTPLADREVYGEPTRRIIKTS
jgi:hypothetical protein